MSKHFVFRFLTAGLFAGALLAQSAGDHEIAEAYEALKTKDYDRAVQLFQQGLEKQPHAAAVRKDLAYTLLKTGENSEARDEFERAIHINPNDEAASLEYAFLCFDTKKPIEARRMFDRLRKRGSAATRATAEKAFQNIDQPLADGIARWQQALAQLPNAKDVSTFSAHRELAELAENRDNLPLAAEQYQICWEMKPQLGEYMLALARVWQQLNRVEEARAMWLAASRRADSRTAETALEYVGSRYPYPYEFVKATDLDPRNVGLRRELAYLYLAMHQQPEAIAQFQKILTIAPDDALTQGQLSELLGFKKRAGTTSVPAPQVDAKAMGQKSLAKGYVRDAIKYLRQAHEQDPDDAKVMLALGRAYNLAKDDREAVQWFDRARRSDDALVAGEANHAWHNLQAGGQPLFTVWAMPMYSSRWKDAFTYGQVKRVVPIPGLKGVNKVLSFYFSTRFIGDARSGLLSQSSVAPQYLSESSFIFGGGVSSKTWHHVTAWAEAGEAVNYLPGRRDVGAAIPDYRGGFNFAKGFGTLLNSKRSGLFYETTADAVYISRFNKDWLFYSQHRAGRTFQLWGNSAELLLNANYTRDSKNQYWANTVELGPGVKVHLPWMPSSVYLSSDLLHGVYTNNQSNPRRPNYNDVRVSLWYALSK